MLYITRSMKTDTPAPIEALATDKRSRNKRVFSLVAFFFGILFARMVRFLAAYDGPWGIKLAVVLAPWAVGGVLILLSRRFYQGDELDHFINRQALAFAVYGALFSLAVLYQVSAAGGRICAGVCLDHQAGARRPRAAVVHRPPLVQTPVCLNRDEEPPQGTPHRPRLVAGRAGRQARRVAPDDQCH
jgi:hypothetical protein